MPAKQTSKAFPTALFKGLVLNPSQLNSVDNTATLCSNVEKSDEGQLTVRKGIKTLYRINDQSVYDDGGSRVLYPFNYVSFDTVSGESIEELVALGMAVTSGPVNQLPRLYKIVENTLTITYVGAGIGRIQFYPIVTTTAGVTSAKWHLTVTVNSIVVLNTDVGTSDDPSVGSLPYFGDVVAAIHALAGFNCSPATFADSIYYSPSDVFGPYIDQAFAAAGVTTFTLPYYSVTSVDELLATGLYERVIGFTRAEYIPPSFQNFNNVMDIAIGTYLYKYDGHRVYGAGLPQASIVSVADAAGGTTHTLGNTYIYKIVFARKDNKLNIIEGADSDDSLPVATHTMIATKDIDLSFKPVNNTNDLYLPIYDARSMDVNGAQVAVNTINIDGYVGDNGLKVGDTAYFYDNISAAYVERLVTDVTLTTITVAGAAVTVDDNIVISNNVRAQIWRTLNNGIDFFLVEEIPNRAASTTQVYTDATVDADLGEQFIEQLRKHSAPPKCSFVGQHQGLRILSGDPEHPTRVYWALPDAPEGFSEESNFTDIHGGGLGAVTGFSTVDDEGLAVFKLQGHVILDGDLDGLTIRPLDRANTTIGCTSHSTLKHVGEKDACIGLSLQGPFLFNGRTAELAIGYGLRPFFSRSPLAQENGSYVPEDFNTADYDGSIASFSIPRAPQRAMGYNDTFKQQYHLYIPAEVGRTGYNKGALYTSSKWFVFDYSENNLLWSELTFYNRYRDVDNRGKRNVSPIGGFTLYKNDLWFGNVVFDNTLAGITTAAIKATLGKFKNTDTDYDYSDDAYPVYMDLHYTSLTRVAGAASAFFKPLWILFYKLLPTDIADPAIASGSISFGDAFSIVIKAVKDFKQYSGNIASTISERIFDPKQARTMLRTKCVTTKARALQVQISNPNAQPFEQPIFDNIEVVYSMPYDIQTKDPKNG